MKFLLVFTTVFFVTACRRGDLSDQFPAPAASPPTPQIVSTVLDPELSEPLQTPTGRRDHRIIFAAGEGLEIPRHRAIVWGGMRDTSAGPTFLSGGALFNPRIKRWTGFDGESAPAGRAGHSLVWAADHLIVWGGDRGATRLPTGSALDFKTKKWRSIAEAQGKAPRAGHAAIWQSGKMLVMGGCDNCPFAAAYDPLLDTWSEINDPATPVARYFGLALPTRWTDKTPGILYIENAAVPAIGRKVIHFDQNSQKWQTLNLPELSSSAEIQGSSAGNQVYVVSLSANASNPRLSLYQFETMTLALRNFELPPIVAAWTILQNVMVVNDSLVILGGTGGDKALLSVAFAKIKENGELDTWSVTEGIDGPLPRKGTSAVPMDNGQFLVWGGESTGPEKYEAKSLVFDLAGKVWTSIAP